MEVEIVSCRVCVCVCVCVCERERAGMCVCVHTCVHVDHGRGSVPFVSSSLLLSSTPLSHELLT